LRGGERDMGGVGLGTGGCVNLGNWSWAGGGREVRRLWEDGELGKVRRVFSIGKHTRPGKKKKKKKAEPFHWRGNHAQSG